MPYKLSWYLEGRIAQSTLTGSVSIEEMEAYNQDLIDKYLNVGQPPVHIISDTRDMRQFPTSLIKVKEINEKWLRHPNLGWAVVVGNSNILLNFLAAAVTKMIGVNYRMVATHEDAIVTLKKIDATVDRIVV
jgi:hypothetical protein